MKPFSFIPAFLLKCSLLFLLVSHFTTVQSQTLTLNPVSVQHDSYSPDYTFADFDNDGDQDLFAGGETVSGFSCKLYKNDNNSFTFYASLIGLEDVASDWGDYDNDGDMDLVYTGRTLNLTAHQTKLYRNDNGVFVQVNHSMTGFRFGTIKFIDYDLDGDKDIFMGGDYYSINNLETTKMYQNNAGIFTEVNVNLPSYVHYSNWTDIDGDAYPDLIMLDQYDSVKVMRNVNGIFEPMAIAFVVCDTRNIALGDYDEDGDIDLMYGSNDLLKIYRNDNLTFVDINSTLILDSDLHINFADCDNDGDLDIQRSYPALKIYSNINHQFSNANLICNFTQNAYQFVTSQALDLEGDGDMDFFMQNNVYTDFCAVLINSGLPANSPPNIPVIAGAVINNNNATINWNAVTDDSTNDTVVTYNLRVGTAPGLIDVLSHEANLVSGKRLVSEAGNAYANNSITLTNLPTGTYYTSVQSIDASFLASQFSAEYTFTINASNIPVPFYPANLANDIDTLVSLQWFPTANATGYFVDVSLDSLFNTTIINNTYTTDTFFVVGNLPLNSKIFWRLRSTNGANTSNFCSVMKFRTLFPFEMSSVFIPNVKWGDVKFGDFNTDGDMDIAISGVQISGFQNSTIYLNNGGVFNPIPTINMPFMNYSKLIFADLNNDNSLDLNNIGDIATMPYSYSVVYSGNQLALSGVNIPGGYNMFSDFADTDNDSDIDAFYFGPGANGVNKGFICENNGTGNFIIQDTIGYLSDADCKWLDWDNDGDQDLIVVGVVAVNQLSAQLYENQNGNFTAITHNIIPLRYPEINVGDYDNDGDVDLMISGNMNYYNGMSDIYIYRNDHGTFNPVNLVESPTFSRANVDWVDYDSDGDLDIYCNYYDLYNPNLCAKIAVNNNGIFSWIYAGMQKAALVKTSWGDFDNDGDPDLVTMGEVSSFAYEGSLYVNRTYSGSNTNLNTIPLPPGQVNAVAAGDSIIFNWNSGVDLETPEAALTYNLAVGTSPFVQNVVSSNSEISNGFYKIAAPGNVGNVLTWTLRNVTQTGWLYYRLQSIDGQYRASNWSTIDSVFFQNDNVPLLVYPYQNAQNLGFDINFVWTEVTSASSYQIDIALDSLFNQNYFTLNNIADTFHLQTNIINNTSYYWRVRANLPSGNYSPWSEIRRFFVNQTPVLANNNFSILNDCSSYDFGDYDADGDMDLVVFALSNTGIPHKISVLNNSNGNFTEAWSYVIPGAHGIVKFADFNNDNRLDIVNSNYFNPCECLMVFMNSNNTFVLDTTLENWNSFTLIQIGSGPRFIETKDYDNDGDVDILALGNTSDTSNYFHHPIVWENSGGNFVAHNYEIEDSQISTGDWVDLDNDGDLDLAVYSDEHYGVPQNIIRYSKIYKNELDSFIYVGLLHPGIALNASRAEIQSDFWADYDSDGDLDCLLHSKVAGANLDSIIILRNDGNFQFTSFVVADENISQSDNRKWGDYDNDGDLDIMLSAGFGTSSVSGREMGILQNDNGIFSNVNAGMNTFMYGISTFVDLDYDHDLDFFFQSFNTSIVASLTSLYYNTCFANTAPQQVQNVFVNQQLNGDVMITWDAAQDNQTPSLGLTYNVEVKNTANNTYVLSPLSDFVTGKLFKQTFGNAMQDTFLILRNLPLSSFTARVQAVDNSFEAGAWSNPANFLTSPVGNISNSIDEQIIVYPNPANEILNIKVLQNKKINAIRVFDSMGHELDINTYGNKIDILNLSTGLYIIEINMDNNTKRLTFTKI
jgi:hypothetical protein